VCGVGQHLPDDFAFNHLPEREFLPMTVSVRLLQLLQEWADATKAGDHARALAAAREALADPNSRAIPGFVAVFQHLEKASTATDDPELASQSLRLREEATQSSVCDFCGRGQRDVPRLVAGGHGLICSDCIMECGAVFSGKATRSVSIAMAPVGDPCSFCGAADVARAKGKGVASICENCVRRIQAALGNGTIEPS
jgi:hypothetical protein